MRSGIQRDGAGNTANYSRQQGFPSMPGYYAGTDFMELIGEKPHESEASVEAIPPGDTVSGRSRRHNAGFIGVKRSGRN
jgi:hypothetical protein